MYFKNFKFFFDIKYKIKKSINLINKILVLINNTSFEKCIVRFLCG